MAHTVRYLVPRSPCQQVHTTAKTKTKIEQKTITKTGKRTKNNISGSQESMDRQEFHTTATNIITRKMNLVGGKGKLCDINKDSPGTGESFAHNKDDS